MIRGAQKNMIVIKTADSDLFEEAYFVLRREKTVKNRDIVAEANRIIEASGGQKRFSDTKKEIRTLLFAVGCFLCGALSGGCIVAAAFLI